MKILNLVRACSLLSVQNGVKLNLPSMNIQSCLTNISIRSNSYKATNLWGSVLSVSTQGSKKGRGKGRAGSQRKNLNFGQEIGTGKMRVEWPGLNAPLLKDRKITDIKFLGEDKDRESRLTELRTKMDKFRRMSIPPHERGWTGGTMGGKSIGPPVEQTKDKLVEIDFSGFDSKILEYKVVATVTSILGKKRSASILVITGNKNGVIGLGAGKAPFAQAAIRLAKVNAAKRLIKIDLFENRTLFHNFYQEFYYTKIYCERKPAGYGLKCHRVIKAICEAVGLKDIHVKIEGSLNTLNMAKAFIAGLLKMNKYQDIANKKGLHVVEMKPQMNNYPVVLASPTEVPIRHQNELKHEFEKDLDLFILNDRYRMKKHNRTPFYQEYPSYKRYCRQRDRDAKQKLARIQRLALLPDETILSTSYPKKPVPKEATNEEAAS